MTAPSPDLAQVASHGAALALTAALFSLLFAAHGDPLPSIPPPSAAQTPQVEISLQQPVPAPPPEHHSPPPTPMRSVRRQSEPRQRSTAENAVPVTAAVDPATPATVPEGGALIAAPSPPAASDPSGSRQADMDMRYAAALRADINSRTRPPDTIQYRLHRPSGEVRVGFFVARNGQPRAIRVIHTSGSAILDEAAVGIVAAGRYPPMPDGAFAGEAEHSFSVTIEFRAT